MNLRMAALALSLTAFSLDAHADTSAPLPAQAKAKAPATFKAKFVTTKGDFTVEVHRDWAPEGADRFYNLVKMGYFNDIALFRVVKGFMVQFGIHGDPKVAAEWRNARIPDDPTGKASNTRGMVTFAMAGPDTRTTQIFINLKDHGASLDGNGFAPFGTVTEGMDVVDKLYSGYGDGADMGGRGPTQDRITKEGKPYLDKNFPNLDSIKSATIIFPEGTAPATKAAPKAAPKTGAPAATKAAPKAAPAAPAKKQ